MNVDPLATHNPVFEKEFYFDGQHNGEVYNRGNLNPYIYCYQNPIKYVGPNGFQKLIIEMALEDFIKEQENSFLDRNYIIVQKKLKNILIN